jgi:hypothetical protein
LNKLAIIGKNQTINSSHIDLYNQLSRKSYIVFSLYYASRAL